MAKTFVIPGAELWDKQNRRFLYTEDRTLTIEHSLYAISKWEAIWHTPFFGKDDKTPEMVMSYIKCMTIGEVDESIYSGLTQEIITQINDYLADPMTATWFGKERDSKGGSKRIITSELIYYWMTALNIPFECEHWHINRLITLIKVCNEENRPKDKIGRKEAYSRNAAINAMRRAKNHSKG